MCGDRRLRVAGCLPAISRTLRRDGIVFEHLRYWHPIFSQWLTRRERLTLHFDPRNLSGPSVPHEGDYPEVPLSDLRMPAVSESPTSRALPPCHRRASRLRSPMKASTSPSVQLRPRVARAWPERAPGTRQGAQGRAPACHPHRHPAAPGGVPGHDLSAGRGHRAMIPSAPPDGERTLECVRRRATSRN